MKAKKSFKVDDKVFAKVKGYPAWPAKITSCNGKKYSVTFYGTGEVANVTPENLMYYLKNKDKKVKQIKRKDFIDGIEEIEAEIAAVGTDGDEYSTTTDSPLKSSNDSIIQPGKRKRSVSNNDSPKTMKLPRKNGADVTTKDEIVEEEIPDEREVKKTEKAVKDSGKVEKEVTKVENEAIDEENVKKEVETDKKEDKKRKEVDKSKKEVKIEADKVKKEEATKSDEKGKLEQNGEEEKGFQLEDKSLKPTDGNKLNKSPRRLSKKKMPSPKKPRKSTDSNKAQESQEENTEKNEATTLDDILLISHVYIKVYMLYAEKVREKEHIYKDKKPDTTSLEDENDKRIKVLPVKVPSQKYVGIKFILPDITEYSSELERSNAEDKIATETLEFAHALENGKEVNDDERIIHNLAVSEKNLPQLLNRNVLKYKKEKLEWLRRENELFDTITAIRATLGLEKVNSELALEGMTNIMDMDLDPLMLKKHPIFFDTIKRLKRYVGNVSEWKLSEDEVEEFNENAKKIREFSEKINKKFQNLFEYKDVDNFHDKYLEDCKQLETDVKDLSEGEFFALYVEPNTRKFLMDQVFDNLDIIDEEK